MDHPDPDRPLADATLDHLYDLAERLGAEIAGPAPDWCLIAREARELAVAAETRRQPST